MNLPIGELVSNEIFKWVVLAAQGNTEVIFDRFTDLALDLFTDLQPQNLNVIHHQLSESKFKFI